MQVLNPKRKVNISPHLLWEYDLSTFDFDRSAFIVIERVIERGTLEDWREMVSYYGKEKILEVVDWSKQITVRDANFTSLILDSPLVNETI